MTDLDDIDGGAMSAYVQAEDFTPHYATGNLVEVRPPGGQEWQMATVVAVLLHPDGGKPYYYVSGMRSGTGCAGGVTYEPYMRRPEVGE